MTTPKNKKSAAPIEAPEEVEIEEVPASKDVEVLAGEPDENGYFTLASGSRVRLNPMRTREIFKLVKIFTVGAGEILAELAFSLEDEEKFAGEMIGLLINAVPEAENETIDFLRSMVAPDGLIERPATRDQRKYNEALLGELWDELENPDPEDTLAILANIIRNEAGNLLALGKKVVAMFSMSMAQLVAKS